MLDRPSLIAMPSLSARSLLFTPEAPAADPPAPPTGATPPAGGGITDPGGIRQISRGKAAGAGGADDFTLDAVFKDGKFLGGKFDSEGHAITREIFEGNEALQRMAKSFHSLQGENTRLKQGKVPLGAPLSEQEYGGLDFTLSQEGTLPEATIKALKGRPIGDHEINLIGQLISQARAANASAYSQWWNDQAAAAQSEGLDLEEAMAYAGEAMDDQTLEEVNAALRMSKFRDAAIKQVLDFYRSSGSAGASGGTGDGEGNPATTLTDLMGGDKPGGKAPLRTGDPPTPPEGGFGGVYHRDHNVASEQFSQDLMKAQGPKQKAAVQEKWNRSAKAHRWQ